MNITRQLQPPAHHRQPQHPQKHAPLIHLSTDCHWASPVSLIQEMGNWTLGCMTHSKAAGKLVNTWDPGTLVLRPGDFNEGKDERKLNCIHCWEALRYLQAPECKFISHCPSSLVLILSAGLPSCSSRKAILQAVSSGFQAQWGAPAVVTLGVRRAGGDWLTPNSEFPEVPILIQTTETFLWLDNVNLHSQWEAFSSQTSGNLGKCLMFPQGTPGWGGWGLRLAWMQGNTFSLWCSK